MSNIKKSELNHIYMFNSALFKNEKISLGSNIFISGINASGKTTMLRLINFFNTANTKVLKKEKKSFYDYFFNYSNSFIVYCYEKEEYDVLVAVYTKENPKGLSEDKLIYRFSTFKKNSYDVESIFNKISRSDIFNELKEREISSYEAKSAKEYLDILYGNKIKKEQSPFVFAKVKNYRNYTDLLYSVFKNDTIDAKSVKNIILDYVKTEKSSTMVVDLNRQEKSLSSFQKYYRLIQEWDKGAKIIPKLREYFLDLNRFNYIKKQKITTMVQNILFYKENIPLFEDKIAEKEQNRVKLSNKIKFIEDKRDKNLKEIIEKKSRLKLTIENLINKYKYYQSDYEFLKMLDEIPKESEYKANLFSAQNSLKTLQSNIGSISDKHQSFIDEIKNFFGIKKENIKSNFLNKKSEIFQKKIENNREIEEHKKDIDYRYKEIDKLILTIQSLNKKINREELSLQKIKLNKIEDNIDWKNLEREYQSKEHNRQNYKSSIKSLNEEQKRLREEDNRFIEKNESQRQRVIDEYKKNIESIQNQIEKINEIINSDGTLYEQINTHGLNINKYNSFLKDDIFLSKDFLFNVEGEENSRIFDFIVNVDSKLFENSKSLTDRVVELKQDKQEEAKRRKRKISRLESEKKKFYGEYTDKSLKIIEKLKIAKEVLDRVELDISEIQNRQDSYIESWKKKNISDIEEQKIKVDRVNEEFTRISSERDNLVNRKKSELSELQSLIYNEKIDIAEAQKIKEIELEKLETLKIEELKKEQDRYSKELNGENIDANEIKKYEDMINELDNKLKAINKWKMKVDEYKKFIAFEYKKLPIKEQEYKLLEEQESKIITEYKKKLDDKKIELFSLDKTARKIEIELKEYNTDNTALQNRISELDAKSDLETIEEAKSIDKKVNRDELVRASELKDDINHIEKKIRKIKEDITNTTNRNFGNFIVRGGVEFKNNSPIGQAKEIISLEDNGWMRGFSDTLYEKIETTIGEISNRYSSLNDSLSDIANAISRINRDLEDIREIDLIDSIKIERKDKDSKIKESMQNLSEYYVMNGHNIKIDLFNTDFNENNKPKILQLLNTFTEELSNSSQKEKEMSVSNLFDLSFDVSEKGNQNKTDKLSDIGSEGTSIMIKIAINTALINIALKGSQKQQTYLTLDEVGRIHNRYVVEIIKYINKKDTKIIAVQPNNTMAKFFDRSYLFESKNEKETTINEYTRKKMVLKMVSVDE